MLSYSGGERPVISFDFPQSTAPGMALCASYGKLSKRRVFVQIMSVS